jgi:LAO/AO transport system kinase
MTARARVVPAAEAVLRHDRRALARLISAVENRDASALPALRALYPHTGRALRIGLTGPLGVGKSSLLNALIGRLRERGRTVGVIAVDPSSPFSGGSVLGDRIRLERAGGDEGLFVRSMASRGYAGGIAEATREVSRLLDAFGMEVVLIETVGSGQVDVDIRRAVSTSVVVLVPHLGDEVQTLKAGLFEIADVFCVNKSDLPGADGAVRYLRELVSLAPRDDARWTPRVVQTSAAQNTGVDELWGAIEAHEAFLDERGERAKAERRRLAEEIVDLVRGRVGERLEPLLERDPELQGLLEKVVDRKLDPHTAADRLYSDLRRRL